MWRYFAGVQQPPIAKKARTTSTSSSDEGGIRGDERRRANAQSPSPREEDAGVATNASPASPRDSDTEPVEREPDPGPPPSKKQQPARKFSERWYYDAKGNKRDWLSVKENVMFCTTCQTYGKDKMSRTSKFVTGCTSMKIESVVSHERTASHTSNITISRAKSLPLEQTPSVQALTKLSDVNLLKMRLLFFNAHAIAKQARPISDYVWMCR